MFANHFEGQNDIDVKYFEFLFNESKLSGNSPLLNSVLSPSIPIQNSSIVNIGSKDSPIDIDLIEN